MENALKMLYMAAGVLVGIAIISIFAYLFNSGAALGESYIEKQSKEQLQLYNSKFEHYNKDCSNPENINTIMDMITVTNLAINVNQESDFYSENTVRIKISIGNLELYVRENEVLDRNYLFKGEAGTDKIYVYDLLSKDKSNLSINSGMENDTDTLSMVDYDMHYKYWFKCTKLEYHEISGRVKNMEFEIVKNNINYSGT